jgi:hypothetical protein
MRRIRGWLALAGGVVLHLLDHWSRFEFVRDKLRQFWNHPGWPEWTSGVRAVIAAAIGSSWVVVILLLGGFTILFLDQRRALRSHTATGARPTRDVRPAPPKLTRLRCVESDPPFAPGDVIAVGFDETSRRIESGCWLPVPPTRTQMAWRHVLAAMGRGPRPMPSLGFRADERPGTDLFVQVTNYGATARVAAWGLCATAYGVASDVPRQYPIAWRESADQNITLRTGETATLHVVHSGRVNTPSVDHDSRLKDWQVITALGCDGRDIERQFFAHREDYKGGVLWFALILRCETDPITRPPASAHYVVENTKDVNAVRLTYKSFSRSL